MGSRDGPSAVERVKAASGYLSGPLAAEVRSDGAAFGADAVQVLKFHGVYQQDDRDVRRVRAAQGVGRDVICMVRASIPGGRLTAAQWLALDRLADEVGDGTLRLTTRQGVQYHFARRGDLSGLIRRLNEHLVTTLAACGDVVRNVMACPAPERSAERSIADVTAHAAALSRAFKPRSSSYWDLWLDGQRAVSALAAEAVHDGRGPVDAVEPLYGSTYLPRKFKIGLARPRDNCVDVYSHDVGIVPHVDGDAVRAFTVLVGGGLGMTHNQPSTFPRLADPLGTVAPPDLVPTVAAVIGVQRDHGDRADRKHARFKYLVDEWGVERVRTEVERRLGRSLGDPEPLPPWNATDDHLGWHEGENGSWYLGVRVPSGRVADRRGVSLRTGLRESVGRFAAEVRITPRQDLLLVGIREEDRDRVDALLGEHGIAAVDEIAPVERHALACPALPTCALALTEAERVLHRVTEGLAATLSDLGIGDEPIHLRMTGCPNGCARPYSTEIGVVGRGNGAYSLFLGGCADGTRLNRPIADRVALDAIVPTLAPILERFRDGRRPGERFGDYCDRTLPHP